MGRRDGRARDVTPRPGPQTTSASSDTGTAIVPDERNRRAALDRLQAQEDQRRIATWLHRYAPLTVHYGPRRWAA